MVKEIRRTEKYVVYEDNGVLYVCDMQIYIEKYCNE